MELTDEHTHTVHTQRQKCSPVLFLFVFFRAQVYRSLGFSAYLDAFTEPANRQNNEKDVSRGQEKRFKRIRETSEKRI